MLEILIAAILIIAFCYIAFKASIFAGLTVIEIFKHIYEPIFAWVRFWYITIPANIVIFIASYFLLRQIEDWFFLMLFLECIPAIFAIPYYRAAEQRKKR